MTFVHPSNPTSRRNRVRKPGGSGADGYRSEWAISQNYGNATTRDARWDYTVSTR